MPAEEIKTHIRRFVAKADRSVVSSMTSKATHVGESQGIPPKGKRTDLWIDWLSGGKIVELWGAVDVLGVMQQLGAIPVPEPVDG